MSVRRNEWSLHIQCVARQFVGSDAGYMSVQCLAKLSVRMNEWSLHIQYVA
jgi:hypothetical protein